MTEEKNEKAIKKLEVFSEVFLMEAFSVIEENVECFAIGDFQDKTLFHTLESFVCEARRKAQKEMLCITSVKEFNSGNIEINFSEEPIMRNVFNGVIDKIAYNEIKKVEEEMVPRVMMTKKVCKNMCASACNVLFEGEREQIKKENIEAKNAAENSKIKTSITPFTACDVMAK